MSLRAFQLYLMINIGLLGVKMGIMQINRQYRRTSRG